MRNEYLTIKTATFGEIYEKKSRFIGYVCPVENDEEAMEFVNSIRQKHKDATHNCYAYQAGEHNQYQRSSDDGEPSGTAGRPILEVIKNSDLHNTAVVITRYFGGTLLGTGGLVKAYTLATQAGIEAAGIVKKIPAELYLLTMEYPMWGKFENFLKNQGYGIKDLSFTDKVAVQVYIPEENVENFTKTITEQFNNQIQILLLDNETWLTVEV